MASEAKHGQTILQMLELAGEIHGGCRIAGITERIPALDPTIQRMIGLGEIARIDHRVHHPVGVLEPCEVLGRADPALEPAIVLARAPAQCLARI